MDNISVIIAYSGKLKLLARNLDVIKTQLKPGDEIVLVDDSLDNIEEFVKNVPYIEYIRPSNLDFNENNMVMARNRGALMAINRIIIFLDEDMLPSDSLLDEYRKVVNGDNVVCGRINWLNEKGDIDLDYRVDNRKFKSKSLIEMDSLANYGLGGGGNFAMTKSSFIQVGGFNTEFNGAWAHEDIDLYRRAHCMGKNLQYDSLALAVHQYHPRNLKGFERNTEVLNEIWGKDWSV